MQEMQDSVEQTFKSGKLYGCDCYYGLSNVNPLNMMGYCLELLQLESIYLACPVFAASACPVYSRLVAALTYAANIKSLRSLHLQIWAPPCSSHILHKIPPVENRQNQHYQEFSSVQMCLNPATLHFLIRTKRMNWNLAWGCLILHEFKLCKEAQRIPLWTDTMRLQPIVQSQLPYDAIHMQGVSSLTEGWLMPSTVILSSLY